MCGRLQLHLGVDAEFRPAKKAHPAFLVQDHAELLERLQTEGYQVAEDRSRPGITRSFAFDPFGNRVEFVQVGRSSERSPEAS